MGTTANLGIMLHVLSNQTVQEIWKAFGDQVRAQPLRSEHRGLLRRHWVWRGVWQHLRLGAEPGRAPAGTLLNAEVGGGKVESVADAPRGRNEHLLLDQVVRTFAENNSLCYLGKKAFIRSLSVDCHLL